MERTRQRNQGCVEGYWGTDPHTRMVLERTADKVRKLLEDQLRTNGQLIWTWLPVGPLVAGVVPCTCDKATTLTSDFRCMSCYGMRLVPGYQKFLFETLHYSSAAALGFDLTNLELDLTKKPNRLKLIKGATTGVLITEDQPYANPGGDPWELELAAYLRATGDTVTLESSGDSGATWRPVILTRGPRWGYRGVLDGPMRPVGIGTLRFRVTLTREAATTESPSFEILRVRHARSRDVNPILRQRDNYVEGQILIIRTWDQELVGRDAARGRTVDAMGDRSQTAPLDFFDQSIQKDSPASAFDDREAGPHPLFEYSSGVRAKQRYAMYAINLDITLDNVLSHQSFSERRAQDGELYDLVF